jgi:hypothetical protein
MNWINNIHNKLSNCQIVMVNKSNFLIKGRKPYIAPNASMMCNKACLTPKGLGFPYVGFIDSGQAAVNAFYF